MTTRAEELAQSLADVLGNGPHLSVIRGVIEQYGQEVREAAAKLPDDHAKALKAEAEREPDPQQAIDDGLSAVSFARCAKAIREMPLP